MEKVCSTCSNLKPLTEFYKHKTSKDKHNSVCKVCSHKRSLETYHAKYKGTDKQKQAAKIGRIRRELGVSKDEYLSLSEQQTHCAVCEKEFTSTFDKQLDHCHTTGRIRKFLCHKCNKGLGLFLDDPKLLLKAANYLENN